MCDLISIRNMDKDKVFERFHEEEPVGDTSNGHTSQWMQFWLHIAGWFGISCPMFNSFCCLCWSTHAAFSIGEQMSWHRKYILLQFDGFPLVFHIYLSFRTSACQTAKSRKFTWQIKTWKTPKKGACHSCHSRVGGGPVRVPRKHPFEIRGVLWRPFCACRVLFIFTLSVSFPCHKYQNPRNFFETFYHRVWDDF